MTTYKDTGSDTVVRDDGAFVPKSSEDYLAWLAEGNTPEPADPPPGANTAVDPAEKLRAFLVANPDVLELL